MCIRKLGAVQLWEVHGKYFLLFNLGNNIECFSSAVLANERFEQIAGHILQPHVRGE